MVINNFSCFFLTTCVTYYHSDVFLASKLLSLLLFLVDNRAEYSVKYMGLFSLHVVVDSDLADAAFKVGFKQNIILICKNETTSVCSLLKFLSDSDVYIS